MAQLDNLTTSKTLLTRVRDWEDSPAWIMFFDRYDPLLRSWCRGLGIDDHKSDELCQQIWVELSERIKTFRYDPSRRFRGWLRRLFESRAIDFLRRRIREEVPSLDGLAASDRGSHLLWIDHEAAEDAPSSERVVLLRESEAIQQSVRSRVTEDSWNAFWMIAVEEQPARDVAEMLNKSPGCVYYAHRRVERLLKEEAQRRCTGPSGVAGGEGFSDEQKKKRTFGN